MDNGPIIPETDRNASVDRMPGDNDAAPRGPRATDTGVTGITPSGGGKAVPDARMLENAQTIGDNDSMDDGEPPGNMGSPADRSAGLGGAGISGADNGERTEGVPTGGLPAGGTIGGVPTGATESGMED